MANFDFRTYCNICWVMFGTSRNVTKYEPSGPLFITEILQKNKKIYIRKYGNIMEMLGFATTHKTKILLDQH